MILLAGSLVVTAATGMALIEGYYEQRTWVTSIVIMMLAFTAGAGTSVQQAYACHTDPGLMYCGTASS